MGTVGTTTLTFDVYVRASLDQVWQGLTDPALVPRWRFGMTFDTNWQAGAPLASRSPDGAGTVLAAAAGQCLTYDWEQSGVPGANGGHSSTVSFELAPMGGITHLRAVHSDLEEGDPFCRIVAGGWPMMLSSLKSLLETGEPLAFPPPG
jgi:uncharacterized protein YndB with AHSA1/START domain